jgi:hypothetical protein
MSVNLTTNKGLSDHPSRLIYQVEIGNFIIEYNKTINKMILQAWPLRANNHATNSLHHLV